MVDDKVTRRLTAIVAADVAGYSRLIRANEDRTLSELAAHKSELVLPQISAHGGRIANTAGDSLLLEFASVVDALRFSIAVQRGMARRNAEIPDAQRIEFRIGINVGDVAAKGGDLLGDGVNVAARVEALADLGGICMSPTARDQVRDRKEFVLEDLGEVEVKNIERPIRVVRAVVDGGTGNPGQARTNRTGRRIVAAAMMAALAVLVLGGFWLWQPWLS